MFTTGFKFFFGLGAALAAAAIVYGYTSGGTHVGPISMGWKGGVGDHLGYGVLATLSVVALITSVVLVAFRDADSEAQAQALGVDEAPQASASAVMSGWWPTVSAFGVGAAVVGLVLHPAVLGLGLIMIVLALVEWTIDVWADQATGDTAANRALRSRIMTPIEIPVIGALVIGVVVLAASRVMLTVSALGAVVVAGVISSLILIGTVVYVARPGFGRQLVSGLGVAASLLLIVGGVLAAVRGERDFQHHGPEAGGHAEDGELGAGGHAEDGELGAGGHAEDGELGAGGHAEDGEAGSE